MLEDAFRDVVAYDFQYTDLKLDNFHVVGDKIMILNPEQICDLASPNSGVTAIKPSAKRDWTDIRYLPTNINSSFLMV